jgi:beta-lactamase class A
MSIKIDIPNDLGEEMWDYCRLNNITDINAFALKLTKQGFTAEKYGSTPINKTTVVEKEVVKEVIKEVPVEKIVTKEVEVIKEVVKEVKVSDDTKVNELLERIGKLESEVSTKEKELKTKDFNTNNTLNLMKIELAEKNKEITRLKEENKKQENKPRDIYNEGDINGTWV